MKKMIVVVGLTVGSFALGCSNGTGNTGGSTVSITFTGTGGSGGAGGAGGSQGDAVLLAAEAAVVGHWQDSNPCEALPTGPTTTSYVNLTFSFDGKRWTNTLSAFADPQCTMPLFQAQIGGAYTLQEGSTVVAGAVDARFAIDTEMLTPQSAAMAAAFTQQMCGGSTSWAVGVAGDVGTTGCLFVPSIMACSAEYDLVKVDATSLRFGQRPMMGDICAAARRPTSLAASTFVHAP